MSIVNAKSTTGHDVPALVGPDGRLLMLGANPRREAIAVAGPWPSSEIIPRASWPQYAFDRRRLDLKVWDQNPLGSCVVHGILRGIIKGALDQGFVYPMLSRGMAYALVNGGRDAGADPADFIEKMKTVGVCTEATVPYRFLRPSQIPASAMEEAKRFIQPDDFVRSCATWDEMVSAAIFGWHLCCTVRVHGRYTDVDANGVSSAERGYGNHEQVGGDALKFTPKGTPLLGFDQSWGEWFGDKGRHFLYEAHFDGQPGMQVYAVKFVNPDAAATDLPPAMP